MYCQKKEQCILKCCSPYYW